MNDLEATVKAYGLDFKDCGNGHVQISGHGVLVNYWPLSKKRTAHCITTGEKVNNALPWDAIQLCLKSSTGKVRPGIAKGIEKKGKAAFAIKPVRTNPAGIKNFDEGPDKNDLAPWEGPPRPMCQSDRLRIAAKQLQDAADQMDEAGGFNEEAIARVLEVVQEQAA